ncbi:ABC transporter permease subunit [Paenibacillus hunanensis]|uniref:ABC transporter permease n=1 Tax=Paenibacillus hunanensis TaxID=539262 RepID=UPI002026EC22|nr:ABC transporter permease subunit [Paenibacillus hunanensis]MCL9662614.1 ABC transporter permease subunit [Paenibacillus hunanensis]
MKRSINTSLLDYSLVARHQQVQASCIFKGGSAVEITYKKGEVARTRKRRVNADGIKLLLMTLPFIIFVIAFSYVPLFGWVYAFFDYRPGIPLSQTTFVGLEHFREMLHDRDMLRVMINTLALSLLSIVAAPLPLLLAIMISEVRSGFFKRLIQTTTTLPNYISWIIVFSLAFSMFSSEGAINTIIARLGLSDTPLNVLGNADHVWMVQTLLLIWKTIGWNAIIYLAAIVGIDGEQYDAAKIDGAGRIRSILYITIPNIMPTFIVLLLLAVSNLLSAGFEQYLVFNNIMVADKIEVLDLYVYRLGLVTNDYPYSTAVGMFKSVISIILLFMINSLSKKVRGESII